MATGPNRVSEIDLLRFFAAFIVVLFHYTFRGFAADGYLNMPSPELAPLSKYGYLGVELFFLISGFVILMTASSGSLQKFIVSRMVRLYPAYWIGCTLTFVAILTLGGGRLSASTSQYLVNMTLLNEFVGVPSIDGVYWSLAVELKFYALVALLLAFRQIHRAQAFLVAWLGITALLQVFPVERLRMILISEYAPYFIAGSMCFLVYSRGLTKTRVAVIVASWAVALRGSLQSLNALERHYQAHFDPVVVAASVSVFFVVMFLVAIKRTGFIARRNWITLGALTYPLYLIHQYIGYMIINMAYPTMSRHWALWGTVALILFLAYLINRYVEQRYSRALKRALESVLAAIWKERPA